LLDTLPDWRGKRVSRVAATPVYALIYRWGYVILPAHLRLDLTRINPSI
jgi:hypothetical protein